MNRRDIPTVRVVDRSVLEDTSPALFVLCFIIFAIKDIFS